MSKKCFLERSAAQAQTSTSKALRIKQKEKVNDELTSLSSRNATMPDIPRSLPHILQNLPPTPESPERPPSSVTSVPRKRDWQGEDADVALVNAFRENSSQESRQEGALSGVPFDPGEDFDTTRRESLESASSQTSFSSPTSPTSPPASLHNPPKKQKREGKDEKIAREKGLNIFISVYDIINIQMDEFNECLEQYKGGVPLSGLLGLPDPDKNQIIQDPETGESKAKMTEEQAVLAREIRRRGKNKNAAQDCRKRANERISHLKHDVDNIRKEKDQKRLESARLAQELRCVEEKNRQLGDTIMRHFNYPTDRFMLVDDPTTGKVEFKRIPEEINRGPPNLIPLRIPRDSQRCHDPPPLLQLGNSRPGVTLQPIANFESYERMPVPHSASLYPLQAAVSHRNLPPSVELFPVALLRNGVRPYPTPSIPMYAPGWNLRRGPAPVPSPADPAIPRNFDPIAHRRLESPSLDRRQESIRAGFSRLADENQLVDSLVTSPKPEGELVIKEEQPEDLSIVSEKDVSIIDPAND